MPEPAATVSQELRDSRYLEGKCVGCGIQLFQLKRNVWRRKVVMVPLTVAGKVCCGQCISCAPEKIAKQQTKTQQHSSREGEREPTEMYLLDEEGITEEVGKLYPSINNNFFQRQEHQQQYSKLKADDDDYPNDALAPAESKLKADDDDYPNDALAPAESKLKADENYPNDALAPAESVLIDETPSPYQSNKLTIDNDDRDIFQQLELERQRIGTIDDDDDDDDNYDDDKDNNLEPDALMPAEAEGTLEAQRTSRVNQVHIFYEGESNESGQPHGMGDIIYYNGDRYQGRFVNGQPHGVGTMLFVDGGEYMGSWEDGYMQGNGTFRFANGDLFTGDYQNSRRCGQGTLYFSNGDLYTGSWQAGNIHGQGRFHFYDGSKFEGSFNMGKCHGKGVLQKSDGTTEIHKYVNGQKIGEGVIWSSDGKKAWRSIYGFRKGAIKRRQANAIIARCEEN